MCWIGLQVISGPTSNSTASSKRSLRRKAKIAGPRANMMSMSWVISGDCAYRQASLRSKGSLFAQVGDFALGL